MFRSAARLRPHGRRTCLGQVQTLIDAFRTRLEQIAADYPGSVVAVNLTGTVKVSEWWDELHPGKVAAKRLAGKFERAINGLLVA